MSTIQEEFAQQATAFVLIIRGMIGAGQIDEASQLLEQYALMNPGDGQIAELKGLIAAAKTKPGTVPTSSTEESGYERPQFLDNTEMVFVVSALGMKRTGFFTSIFNKIKLMEEKLGYDSTILTISHSLELRKTEIWLKTFSGSSKLLPPGTKVLNVYEYFQDSYADGLETKAVYSRVESDDALRYEKESDNTYAAYKGDELVRLDIFSGYQGSLRAERFYSDGRLYKDVFYDDWGYLNCVREYGFNAQCRAQSAEAEMKCYTEYYYTTGGELCIEALFDEQIDNSEPYKILLYDKNGTAIKEFGSNYELAAYYLSLTMNSERFYLLDFEGGLEAQIAGFLEKAALHKKAARVCVIHSIFLEDAYKPKLGPQKFYRYVCSNPGKFDGIIFLTKDAQRDFVKLYGHRNSTFVIPHPYPFDIERTEFEKRDLRKAVVVSRLFPEKQLDITLHIFAAVARTLPDVRLEIYGRGPLREQIEELIRELKMENNVFLMGYTDDALSVYRTAVLSMSTSMAEGYGFTIMESICNGCPAFSRDIKYGPAEIITPGKTGFLIKRNDFEGYARKMVEYFENTQLMREMSEACYNDAERFGMERFLENWLGMTEAVYNEKRKG